MSEKDKSAPPLPPRTTAAQIFQISDERKKKSAEQDLLDSDFYKAHSEMLDVLNGFAAKHGHEEAAKLALHSNCRYIVFFMSGGGRFHPKINGLLREKYVAATADTLQKHSDQLIIGEDE